MLARPTSFLCRTHTGTQRHNQRQQSIPMTKLQQCVLVKPNAFCCKSLPFCQTSLGAPFLFQNKTITEAVRQLKYNLTKFRLNLFCMGLPWWILRIVCIQIDLATSHIGKFGNKNLDRVGYFEINLPPVDRWTWPQLILGNRLAGLRWLPSADRSCQNLWWWGQLRGPTDANVAGV